MKNSVRMATFSLIFLIALPLQATEVKQPSADNAEMANARSLDRMDPRHIDNSYPDNWGAWEVFLGGDTIPKAQNHAKERGKKLAEYDKKEKERLKKIIDDLWKKLEKSGYDKKGWRVSYDGENEPHIVDQYGNDRSWKNLDAPPSSDPDDWGEKERIL